MNNQKFTADVQKTQNMFDKTVIRSIIVLLNLFQHIYRDWNEKADCVTHDTWEKGVRWVSFMTL